MAKISQKDYLKKYLSSDSKLKKKKKSKSDGKPKIKATVRIIDDDDYVETNHEIDENDLYATNEEAPQIVGEIDDRPPELQVLDYRQNSKWKSLSSVETKEQSKTSNSRINISSDESPPRQRGNRRSEDRAVRKRKNSSDNSPPRNNKNNRSPDNSPPRRKSNNNNYRDRSPDNSPPRRNNNRNDKQRSPDNSPPRRNDNKSHGNRSPDNSPPRRNNNRNDKQRSPDNSPPRRNNNRNDKHRSPDNSPPRRNDNKSFRDRSPDNSPPRRNNNNNNNRNRAADNSPPRKNNNNSHRDRSPDNSPPRRNNNNNYGNRSNDNSPPRRNNNKSYGEPSRQQRSDNSPPRNRFSSRESPPRRIKTEGSRFDDIKKELSPPRSSKMTKTLDGKASGLQDAKTLRKENDAFKEKQDRLFDEMRPEMSGKNADLVVRERRGRNRDFDQEMEEERQKSEFEAARKQVYDRWGKGLKQIEDFEKRTEEYKHEVNKPLARMADDQDLQDHLKDQERADDPMLQYMRKKKTEENRKKGIEEKPLYKGQFPQNRYNIPPGYRWDGVDRSSGYEKKLFEVSAAKKASAEEAYRYATEDM
ncbi:unnamed protein product [Diamesa hyperborea]